MPLSPQRPRLGLHVDAGNPSLANGCQNSPPSTPAGNPSGAPRTTLNKPEQIRTNLNTAERPDQIGAPKNHPRTPRKKQNPNTVAAHPPSFLPAQE